MRIREAQGLADLDAVVAIQREVWNLADIEVNGRIQLRASQHVGACLLVAEVEAAPAAPGGIVGFAYAFPAYRDGRVWWHSDMTAVTQSHRARGVGQRLKWAQRDAALKAGIDRITWTFDPMRRRNAHLNLNLLGVTCSEYLENFYGVTSSDLHHGLPTDRLVADWDLTAPRVFARAGTVAREIAPAPEAPPVETWIEIPEDWSTLVVAHPEGARMRQRETARAFREAFARGFVATRFDRENSRYALTPQV
jgi:predicted GNAT superfamily acetyltransferase